MKGAQEMTSREGSLPTHISYCWHQQLQDVWEAVNSGVHDKCGTCMRFAYAHWSHCYQHSTLGSCAQHAIPGLLFDFEWLLNEAGRPKNAHTESSRQLLGHVDRDINITSLTSNCYNLHYGMPGNQAMVNMTGEWQINRQTLRHENWQVTIVLATGW